MQHQLEQEHPEGLDFLRQLFGSGEINLRLNRLNESYKVTEAKWEENIQRYLKSDLKIKYVLFGEAAPWSADGEVNYFYNNSSGSWCRRVISGIIPNFVSHNRGQLYSELVKKQFILIDTLPFAMEYSTKQRKSSVYKQMIESCSQSYLHRKLFDSSIKWDESITVGFAVKYNAVAMMNVFPNGLLLPNGKKIVINDDLIVTDGTNYPSSEKIRQIFSLSY